jgi:hypothetical protein
MYHPYFRGKQYELITVRETASLLAVADFRPIIEPVRSEFGGLQRALDAVRQAKGHAVVIVNPQCGDLSEAGDLSIDLFNRNSLGSSNVAPGILLSQGISLAAAMKAYETHASFAPVFIHAGFTEPKPLAEALGKPTKDQRHVFVDRLCGKLYQRHFKGSFRVLLRDGFKRMRNADYVPVEPFSDLHATYTEEGMDGFGDFLTVGDEYNEGGGPAYAVAIHLTFIDPEQDDAMQIYHFVSERQLVPTPKDPAGKFAEALAQMIETLDKPGSKVAETRAVAEFRGLYKQGHFPGLGYIKELSMSHHIQTLARYFKTAV